MGYKPAPLILISSMMTRNTSFGKLAVLLEMNKQRVIEHLIFETKGRGHSHSRYESFVVLSGTGKVFSGDKEYIVRPGSLVTIPPETDHRMEPDEGTVLEGFLWYHDESLQVES